MRAAVDAPAVYHVQDEGNYKVAHTKLLGTVKQLEGLGCKPPQELMRALCLLHR